MPERLVTLCLLLKRLKTGRGKIKVVCCSLPLLFFDLITVNTQIYGLNVFCLKYRKCCGAQRGKERRENKRGSGSAERAAFHEGLEHFVKYYVFTKKESPQKPQKQSIMRRGYFCWSYLLEKCSRESFLFACCSKDYKRGEEKVKVVCCSLPLFDLIYDMVVFA